MHRVSTGWVGCFRYFLPRFSASWPSSRFLAINHVRYRSLTSRLVFQHWYGMPVMGNRSLHEQLFNFEWCNFSRIQVSLIVERAATFFSAITICDQRARSRQEISFTCVSTTLALTLSRHWGAHFGCFCAMIVSGYPPTWAAWVWVPTQHLLW